MWGSLLLNHEIFGSLSALVYFFLSHCYSLLVKKFGKRNFVSNKMDNTIRYLAYENPDYLNHRMPVHNEFWNVINGGRVTHIGVSKLTIIGSDSGLAPGRCQAIIWTNDGILLIGPLETNFNEMFIDIHTFAIKKMHLQMSSIKWRALCLGLNKLIKVQYWGTITYIHK